MKQPETIVVDENPETVAREDTTTEPETTSADFKQLNIGEIHPISTLDPLFADNNSARRTLQILYEGVVRFDQNGEIVPAISSSWEVSDDSLTYTFTLRNDIFYHDSEIFSSGRGRRLVASDVKFALERMAKNSVPDDAARLFMAIEGFEPFFNEQHHVLNPAYRELSGVSGITLPDDTTVRFRLVEKDPHLLQKLASPYAVIYPPEAVKSTPQDFEPVGTGPFELSQTRGDSVYIFSRNNQYRQQDRSNPMINRVDVVVEDNESQQLKALASGDIHLIPEIGPRIAQNILNEEGALQPGYAEGFTLDMPGGTTTYTINFNPGSSVSERHVRSLFSDLDTAQLSERIPRGIITITATTDTVSGNISSRAPDQIYSTFTRDPYELWMLQRVSSQWGSERQIQLVRLRTPSRNIALYTGSSVPYFPGQSMDPDRNTLLQYSVKQSALSISELENLRLNRYPWWIDVRNIDLPGIDQL